MEKLKTKWLTIKDLVVRFDVKRRVAQGWCQRGVLAGAKKKVDAFGVAHWLVPESSLLGFVPQRRSGKPRSVTASKASVMRRLSREIAKSDQQPH